MTSTAVLGRSKQSTIGRVLRVTSGNFLEMFDFFLYGIYAAATEGISKAWITNITHKIDTATAIGTYSALQSICTMLASSLTGFIWFKFGAAIAFMVTAAVTLLIVFYFYTIPPPGTENLDIIGGYDIKASRKDKENRK